MPSTTVYKRSQLVCLLWGKEEVKRALAEFKENIDRDSERLTELGKHSLKAFDVNKPSESFFHWSMSLEWPDRRAVIAFFLISDHVRCEQSKAHLN